MAYSNYLQTKTTYDLFPLPSKELLCEAFVGKSLDDLQTPCMIIDRSIFAKNCAEMQNRAQDCGMDFRAHIKSHKTSDGVRLQLESGSRKTHAVVVSTMMEAWRIVESGLVAEGVVKDILYGLPVGVNKIQDLIHLRKELAKHGGVVRLLVDHPIQVRALQSTVHDDNTGPWSAFIKVDAGYGRAGLRIDDPAFRSLVNDIITSSNVALYGFYSHAGNSYASTNSSEASIFLSSEIDTVDKAVLVALDILKGNPSAEAHYQEPFVLSVGSTPTAHAVSPEKRKELISKLHGTLELHAGNYPMLDLQQEHTGLINIADISQKIISTVISSYPGRGPNGTDEMLCDAGAIALSKDTGPKGGFGDVIGKSWRLVRISQEHGILGQADAADDGAKLNIGDRVEIIGQHACLIAAAHLCYYITDAGVDQGRTVVDVWVPWKGW